jgi:polar amino acid transport system ATP-binding protein
VNRIEPIDSGRIVAEGEEITARGVDANRIRRRIGIVYQSFNLFPHMSVLRNVTLAPGGCSSCRAQRRTRARSTCSVASASPTRRATTRTGSRADSSSASRSCALAMQPDLILLDEVTSALDPELVGEVLALIGELAESGMTMLIATHEMSFARDIADRLRFLDDGVVLEEGTPSEVLTRPREARTQQFLQRIIDAGWF